MDAAAERQDFDLVVRGGRVVDGTGLPPYKADIGVRDGRIASIGRIEDDALATARRVIDAEGLTVMPGFVDIHTHYDAQLHFEPTASPASWHGVTTVLMGNCGFTIAPAREGDVPWLLSMLSRVEGMPPPALEAGVTFPGGSVGDFLDGLDGRIAINAAAFVGHSAVRRYVMGDDSQTREATPDEIQAMQELVRAAMREGAAGFSTSQLVLHQAHNGLPVPSNLASHDEVVALSAVLAEFPYGTLAIIPRSSNEGFDEEDQRLLHDMATASGKSIDLGPIVWFAGMPDSWKKAVQVVDDAAAEGLRYYPGYAVHKGGAFFALDNTFLFDDVEGMRAALVQPEPQRSAALRDPAVRNAIRSDMAAPTNTFPMRYDITTVYSVHRPEHESWVGRPLQDLIDERGGGDQLDAFLDLALEDDLLTTFRVTPLSERGGRAVTEQIVTHPMMVPGSSDGGAHLASFVGADFTTRLLTEWVPNPFTLEEAVRRLTAIPAAMHGIHDRGELRVGAWADIVLADLEHLTVGLTRWVDDFPGDSGRLVVDADGYRAVIVNGEVILEDGKPTGALSGQVLRFS
ncbi:MAG: aminoacylase [Actinomycetia bacterium]|nr:aminoacylase [Actinomycetes bacterium]